MVMHIKTSKKMITRSFKIIVLCPFLLDTEKAFRQFEGNRVSPNTRKKWVFSPEHDIKLLTLFTDCF